MTDNVKTMSLDDLLDELVMCGEHYDQVAGMIPDRYFLRAWDIKEEIKKRCGEGS